MSTKRKRHSYHKNQDCQKHLVLKYWYQGSNQQNLKEQKQKPIKSIKLVHMPLRLSMIDISSWPDV